jgi:hypothetical protein
MMLIGLTGKARCGKDTIADVLVEDHGFTRVAFADPLKLAVGSILGMNAATLEEFKDNELDFLDGVTPRRMLQTLGTEWGRETIHPEIWIRIAREKIQLLQEMGNHNIVITDVRFDNEAELLALESGVVFQVVRPGGPEVEGHASEEGVSSQLCNGVIYNTGTKEELWELIPEWLNQLES